MTVPTGPEGPLPDPAFAVQARALADAAEGPFTLHHDDAYKFWRDAKLARFPNSADELVVEIRDPAQPTAVETQAVMDRVARANMAIYAGPPHDEVDDAKSLVRAFGAHFGLQTLDLNPYADEDALSPIHVAVGNAAKERGRRLYIPYTDRPINWHTDGYYNPSERRIRGMILHCVRNAAQGGENALFDPEIAYILLRERDPGLIAALGRLDAMTIPGNAMDDGVTRGDVSGPVFSLNRADGSLYMRYTARKRNIVWADTPDTARAVAALGRILDGADGGADHVFTHRLAPGQGVICNNVLHTRTGFTEESDAARMMLRGRYLERVVTKL